MYIRTLTEGVKAMDAVEVARRRQEIVRYFGEHGGTATAKHYGLNRSRVYQIVNKMLHGKPQRPEENPR